jgi:heme-degrading monooxygenase HmoA
MIVRFVKMEFQEDKVDEFKRIFNSSCDKIRSFKGVQSLELLQGSDNKSVFFTRSVWDTTESLENYRHSELFKSTWSKTKVLFKEKPEAWTLEVAKSI